MRFIYFSLWIISLVLFASLIAAADSKELKELKAKVFLRDPASPTLGSKHSFQSRYDSLEAEAQGYIARINALQDGFDTEKSNAILKAHAEALEAEAEQHRMVITNFGETPVGTKVVELEAQVAALDRRAREIRETTMPLGATLVSTTVDDLHAEAAALEKRATAARETIVQFGATPSSTKIDDLEREACALVKRAWEAVRKINGYGATTAATKVDDLEAEAAALAAKQTAHKTDTCDASKDDCLGPSSANKELHAKSVKDESSGLDH